MPLLSRGRVGIAGIVATLGAAAALGAGLLAPAPQTPQPVVPSAGYTRLTFDDEFTGGALDTTKWVALNRLSDQSNNEKNCYLPSAVQLYGGAAVIKSYVGSSTTCTYGTGAPTPASLTTTYYSGFIQQKSFNQTYGVWEARIKMPGASGSWPAFWMGGANCQKSNVYTPDNTVSTSAPDPTCNWPNDTTNDSAEIDIAEEYSSYNSLKTNNNAFADNSTGTATADSCLGVTLGFNSSAGYHTYDLVWSPSALKFYADRTLTCTITSAVAQHPMDIYIDNAMGGNNGGTITDAAYPQTMQIDYVRVWK